MRNGVYVGREQSAHALHAACLSPSLADNWLFAVAGLQDTPPSSLAPLSGLVKHGGSRVPSALALRVQSSGPCCHAALSCSAPPALLNAPPLPRLLPQFASIVGNETSVHSGRSVPPQHNLQGDLLYPGGATTTPEKEDSDDESDKSEDSDIKDLEKGAAADAPPARVADFDIFAPAAPPSSLMHKLKAIYTAARVVLLTLAMDAGTGAACWAPSSVGLAAFMGFLKVRRLRQSFICALLLPADVADNRASAARRSSGAC